MGAENSTSILQTDEVLQYTHIASASLPAAGAYTTQDADDIPLGSDEIVVAIVWTPGSATSQFKFKLEWAFSADATDFYTQLVQNTLEFTTADPLGQIDLYSGEIPGPLQGDTNLIRYCTPNIRVPVGARKLKVSFAEVGDIANPGTLEAMVYVLKQDS